MKKILLSTIIVALAFVSFAKNEEAKIETTTQIESISAIELTGFVTDKISNEALVGVEVKIEGTNQKTYTDFDGKFSFPNLKPGEYNLVSTYISYQKNVTGLANINSKNNSVTIKLEASN